MELVYLNQSQAGQHRFFSCTVMHSCLQFSWVDHTGTWHVLRCPGLVFLSCFCPCPDEGAPFLQCLPKAGPCPGRSVHCIGCWGSCFPRPSDLPEGGASQCAWSEQTPPSLSGYSQKFPPPLVSTCWWLTLSLCCLWYGCWHDKGLMVHPHPLPCWSSWEWHPVSQFVVDAIHGFWCCHRGLGKVSGDLKSRLPLS